jgi:hypothetical protein
LSLVPAMVGGALLLIARRRWPPVELVTATFDDALLSA